MADTKLFLIILSVLAITSITTALIIQSYQSWNTYGNDTFTGKCEGLNNVYCPYNPGLYESLRGTQDLTTDNILTSLNSSYMFCIGSCPLHWIFNNGIGVFSSNDALNINYHYMYLKGVNKNNDGYYRVNYTVNNTVKENFIITIHDSRDSNFGLEFTDDGIKIPSVVPYFYNAQYPVRDFFNNPEFTITTAYNTNTRHLLCYVNNQLIINDYQFDITEALHKGCTDTCYYGGIGAKASYVTLENYYVYDGQSTNILEDEPSFWDKILDIVPWGHEIWNFTNTFITIANPMAGMTTTDSLDEPIIPWWLSVLFDILIIGVVAYGVTVLRGN